MTEVAIGIDIGGTNTVIGAVNKTGDVVGEVSIPTSGFGGFDAYFEKLVDGIRQLNSIGTFVGIGLGSPAGNRFIGSIQAPSNVDWQGTIPIGERLNKVFQLPIVVDNDANTAAIGEMVYGAAKGLKDFIVITLGTGIGSGIVINGNLLYGAHGFAGELGHMIAVPNGRQCGCGKQGCLETYASATGIKRTLFELLGQTIKPSRFRSLPYDKIESKDIYTAALDGDEVALQAFEQTGEILGRRLADYSAFSDPQAYILFGGLAKSGDLLLKPLKKAFDKELLFLYKDTVTVSMSELMSKNAAVLGASALVWNEVGQMEVQGI